MRIPLLLALTVPPVVFAAGPAGVRDFVPGEKITYPVRSAGMLEHAGRAMMINCRSRSAAIERSCRERLEQRITECRVPQPEVYASAEHYRPVLRIYLQCVMPMPICQGVEVTSGAECRAIAAAAAARR